MSARSTALVAGGAGYIGSHACKALSAAGFLPVAYDNLSTGHRDLVRWGPLVEGDLIDAKKLAEAFAEHRLAVALHFAACAYVGESFEDPAKYYTKTSSARCACSMPRVRRATCRSCSP